MGKHPYAKKQPRTDKQAFGAPPHVEEKRPVWRLRDLDWKGPFACNLVDAATLERVVRRLGDMESIPWDRLHETGSHSIDVATLHRDARRRLEEVGQDDVDELYSVRISAKERVFGIRDRWILRILWWDPDHQVCPSTPKHT